MVLTLIPVILLFSFPIQILMFALVWMLWKHNPNSCAWLFLSSIKHIFLVGFQFFPPVGTMAMCKLPHLCSPEVSILLSFSTVLSVPSVQGQKCPREEVYKGRSGGGRGRIPLVLWGPGTLCNQQYPRQKRGDKPPDDGRITRSPQRDLLCVCVFSFILADAERISNSSWAPWSWQQTSTDRMSFWPNWKLTCKTKT